MRVEWLERMNAALDVMEEQMEGKLDIESIAKAAYVSPFHFQRMFHMVTGMTVAEYTRKRKLTLAAQELAMTNDKVIDVAYKYGYDSPESFAKAFRKIHGISPSEARQPGVQLKAFPRISFHVQLRGDKDMDYRIVEKEAFSVVGKSIRVDYSDNEHQQQIPRFWADSARDGTMEKLESIATGDRLYGVCLALDSESGGFEYMIAAESETASAPEGFKKTTIPAATWAVFTSVGPIPGAIQKLFGRIFQEWFPSAGYEHANAPELEVYPPGDTQSEDYRCEVWIPVVKK